MWQNGVKGHLYYFLRRWLSPRKRDEIKKWLSTERRRMSRVFTLLHGTYTAKELIDELKRKIPGDTEILMIHSSYDHLLPMYCGRPREIVDELIGFCGGERTLVMPAFCLGGRRRDKKAYYRTHVFDVRKSVSEMGLLTEIFRRLPGVKRSLHPTHSICALGPLASQLTATHHLAATRTGKGTPFQFMAEKRCVLAGVGVEYFRALTQTHSAEDTLGKAFPVAFEQETVRVTIVDWDGNRIPYDLSIRSTSKTLDNTILHSLLKENELREWAFRGTPLFVTFADKVTKALLDAAKNGITVYGSFNPGRKSG